MHVMALHPHDIAAGEPGKRLAQEHNVVVDLIGLDVKRGVLQVVARAAHAGEDLRLIGRETTVIPHRGYEARRGWLVLVIRSISTM